MNHEFVLPDNKSFSISNSAVNALIQRGDGTAALLYLHILQEDGNYSEEDSASALHLTKYEIRRAMNALAEIGLVSSKFCTISKEPIQEILEDSLPEYPTEDITNELNKKTDFSYLVKECQRRLCKVFSASDLSILYGIYDYLELPVPVIFLMLTHCINESKEKLGEGHFPTLKKIEKTAFAWKRMGLVDYDSADAYLNSLEEKKKLYPQLLSIFQVENRNFTAHEKNYIDSWISLGFDIEAIEIAYNRTITQTGKLAWPYLNKIILKWNEKGLHTKKEIELKDTKKPSSYSKGNTQSEFDDNLDFIPNNIRNKYKS